MVLLEAAQEPEHTAPFLTHEMARSEFCGRRPRLCGTIQKSALLPTRDYQGPFLAIRVGRLCGSWESNVAAPLVSSAGGAEDVEQPWLSAARFIDSWVDIPKGPNTPYLRNVPEIILTQYPLLEECA